MVGFRFAPTHPTLAERRQGGSGFVIDSKHFKKNDLPKHDVDTTLAYKCKCNASKAIIIVSDTTVVTDETRAYADEKISDTGEKKVIILHANRNLKSNIKKLFDKLSSMSKDANAASQEEPIGEASS